MDQADKKCCVSNCGKNRSQGVILHSFPSYEREPDRFRAWIYAIGGDILGLDNSKICKYRKVCHNHFEEKFKTSSKRLAVNAIPTLNLPGMLHHKVALKDVTNKNVTNIGTENLDGQTQLPNAEAVQSVPQPQPSTSKGMLHHRVALKDVTNKNVTHIGTENLDGQTQLPNTEAVQSVSQPQPSTSKGATRVKKYLSSCFSSEASTLARQIKKLQATKDKYALKLKKAKILSENSTFQKAIRNFTSLATIFTLLQFREINKDKMGRRFTRQEKIMALSLYKQGPRAYRWLRNIFVLPSPMTLSRMISLARLNTGINENIFEQLKNITKKMKDTEKCCILLFDEISLAPNFQYNKRKDRIIGFVDNGASVTKKIADHALVFMIRGVQKNYKQPIGYTFCNGSTPKEELARQIKEMIKTLHSVGFKVVATVCDQGASNVSAINHLIQETRAKYLRQNLEFKANVFEIDHEEIVPLYDPPHLIKGIRNNLLNKNLVCTINNKEKVAKWDHIIQLYKEDPGYQGIRQLPKLTENHVTPTKIKKMKVNCATQVFSRSVGSCMGYLAEKGILDKKCTETADVIIFFDELFDSVNGGYINSKNRSGKPLLGPLTPHSCHHKLWTTAKMVLKSMKFINSNGNPCTVPTIRNWLRTIENLEYLSNGFFKRKELNSVWLRHFNQDPLENFFGCIRSHGARNTNPTCAGFETAFASLLVNNLNSIHSPGSNCEKDNCRPFKSLKKLFFNKNKITSENVTEVNIDHIFNDKIFVDFEDKKKNPKIYSQVEYVTGYILRKLKRSIKKCKKCKSYLYDETKSSEYIARRDFSHNKKYLSFPSPQIIDFFSKIQDIFVYIIQEESEISHIKNYIKTIISILCDFSFIECSEHRNDLIDEIMDISCQFFLNNWCKDTNKLLKGIREDFDPRDKIQSMARLYYIKHKKQ